MSYKTEHLDLRGIYFGYPSCCIDEYYPGKPESPGFEGTGFACCHACAQRPVKDILAEIADNRVCGLEFPKEHTGDADYWSNYYSGLLFRVLLYRDLSNQQNDYRLKMIRHYQGEVQAANMKVLVHNTGDLRNTYEVQRDLKVFAEMQLALQQCMNKVTRLMARQL